MLLGLALLLLLFIVHPLGASATFLVLGAGAAVFLSYAKKTLDRVGKTRVEHQSRLVKRLDESLGTIKELKLFGREKVFVDQFAGDAATIGDSLRTGGLYLQYPRLVIDQLGISAIILLLLLLNFTSDSTTDVAPVIALYAVTLARMMPSATRE